MTHFSKEIFTHAQTMLKLTLLNVVNNIYWDVVENSLWQTRQNCLSSAAIDSNDKKTSKKLEINEHVRGRSHLIQHVFGSIINLINLATRSGISKDKHTVVYVSVNCIKKNIISDHSVMYF